MVRGHTKFNIVHELPRNFDTASVVLLLLFCVVFLRHLIEFPFLELCLCLDSIDFLTVSRVTTTGDIRSLSLVPALFLEMLVVLLFEQAAL